MSENKAPTKTPNSAGQAQPLNQVENSQAQPAPQVENSRPQSEKQAQHTGNGVNRKQEMRKNRLKQFLHDKNTRQHSYALKIPGLIRIFAVALIFLIEVLVIFYLAYKIDFSGFLFVALEVVSLIFVLFGLRKGRNQHYFTAWIIIILGLPGMGLIFYLLWGRPRAFKKLARAIDRQKALNAPYMPDVNAELDQIAAEIDPNARLHARYLASYGFPLYRGQKIEYFGTGEEWFEVFFQDLARAEHFILLEYFIIQDGYIWDKVHDILLEKARQGVQCYLLYDDLGCVAKLDSRIKSEFAAYGIRVVNFNPVLRYAARLYVNYRNHQKIAVIDGKIGHLGGTNLADEYANLVQRFGYWKDVALRIEGPAVQSLTATFLKMWATEAPDEAARLTPFLTACPPTAPEGPGFTIPYDDGPLTTPENPAEMVYNSLINTAEKRLWIMTPYFVVDSDLLRNLGQAAQSGVDVRLITPYISDKWYVHLVTRSNYRYLLQKGARVYEYTPGFIHAKTVLCDDDRVVTGSVNFDFRSFNLLFENAAFLYREAAIQAIHEDFLETFAESREIRPEDLKSNILLRLLTAIARLFSPLL